MCSNTWNTSWSQCFGRLWNLWNIWTSLENWISGSRPWRLCVCLFLGQAICFLICQDASSWILLCPPPVVLVQHDGLVTSETVSQNKPLLPWDASVGYFITNQKSNKVICQKINSFICPLLPWFNPVSLHPLSFPIHLSIVYVVSITMHVAQFGVLQVWMRCNLQPCGAYILVRKEITSKNQKR